MVEKYNITVLYLSHFFKWPTHVSCSAKCMKQCHSFLKSWMFIKEVFWKILTWSILLQIIVVLLLKQSMQIGTTHCLTLCAKKSKPETNPPASSQLPTATTPNVLLWPAQNTWMPGGLCFDLWNSWPITWMYTEWADTRSGRWASTDYHRNPSAAQGIKGEHNLSCSCVSSASTSYIPGGAAAPIPMFLRKSLDH